MAFSKHLPMKVADILRPRGGISQTAVLTLLGIHSTKYDEFLFWTLSICSSTSFIDIRPRKIAATVKYRPCRGSQAAIMFLASNICCVNSGTVKARYCWEPRDVSGAKPGMKKWRRGNGTMLTANLRKSAFNWPERQKKRIDSVDTWRSSFSVIHTRKSKASCNTRHRCWDEVVQISIGWCCQF